jgi:hypothetical protein
MKLNSLIRVITLLKQDKKLNKFKARGRNQDVKDSVAMNTLTVQIL